MGRTAPLAAPFGRRAVPRYRTTVVTDAALFALTGSGVPEVTLAATVTVAGALGSTLTEVVTAFPVTLRRPRGQVIAAPDTVQVLGACIDATSPAGNPPMFTVSTTPVAGAGPRLVTPML